MTALIVEDEQHAATNLINLLKEIEPSIEIFDQLDTVSRTVDWLKENKADLLFLDIHLADSLSFNIFKKIEVKTPVIFTTAYDKYALKAFKVNSIDYLLKPIEKEDLAAALQKFKDWKKPIEIDFEQLQTVLAQKNTPSYKKRFLVKRGDKMLSVKAEKIAYVEGEDKYTFLVTNENKRYIIDHKLNELESMLDPEIFFRLNRSFITHYDAIDKVVVMSKSRVKIYLDPLPSRDIVVSTDNTRNFKAWFGQ